MRRWIYPIGASLAHQRKKSTVWPTLSDSDWSSQETDNPLLAHG
jgi:hypothetical protein